VSVATGASLPRRLAALAYEALLVAALALVVGFLTVPLSSSAPGTVQPLRVPDLPARVLSFALVFAAAAVYFGWSWTAHRRTLAMKTWRIALVRTDAGPLTRKIALVRYFCAWIGPVAALAAYLALRPVGLGALALPFLAFNFLWALVDPDRQFLHDRIAGTRIVNRE
jgi:uncharacterized RDD family membrane protein YckC